MEAVKMISDELDYTLEPISEEFVRQKLYKSVLEHLSDCQPGKIALTWEDFMDALAHVLMMVAVIMVLIAIPLDG